MLQFVEAPFHIPIRAYQRQLDTLVRLALAEDIGRGDATVKALNLGASRGKARLIAKSPGILAGVDAFESTLRQLDPRCELAWQVSEGTKFRAGTLIAVIHGRAAALLSGERTAINFLAHLSGIATAARTMADLIPQGTARLLDTRKTTPGWRYLEKRAVIIGGAVNHRLGLHDALMVKDTHVGAAGSPKAAMQRALAGAGRKIVICEIHNRSEIDVALKLGARWLLLDNFHLGELRDAVKRIRRFELANDVSVTIEASGGITAKTVASIARCGVDFVSLGSITHSAPAVDFSMKWVTR